MAPITVQREGTDDVLTFDTVAEVGSAAEFISSVKEVWGEGVLLKPNSTSAFTARTPEPFPQGIYTYRGKSAGSEGGTGLPTDLIDGLRELVVHHRTKKTPISMSGVKSEHWAKIQSTAKLKLHPSSVLTPTTPRSVERFSWDDTLERSQAFRYIPFLKKNVRFSGAGQQGESRLSIVDAANSFQRCLETRGLEHFLFYDIKGTTDVLFSLTGALQGMLPESGSVGALELKKGKITRRNVAQACVTLVILNIKSQWLQPWVLLTDLRDQYIFYWLDGSVVYFYSTPMPAAAWGILDDLLKHDKNVNFEDPPADVVSRLAILQRQQLSEAILDHGGPSDVANLDDVMDASERETATVLRVLQQLSIQPVLGPMIPTKPAPMGMYV